MNIGTRANVLEDPLLEPELEMMIGLAGELAAPDFDKAEKYYQQEIQDSKDQYQV